MIQSRFVIAPVAVLTAFIVSVSLLSSVSCARAAGSGGVVALAAQEPITVTNFDAPFLFTCLSWEKKAVVENGRAVLTAPGVNFPTTGAWSGTCYIDSVNW